jgi:hypothetical protein
MTGLIDEFRHYASEFYDPAKAHDYYMRNRELKGRKPSTKGLTKKQRDAWGYAKTQISALKKSDITEAKNVRKNSTEQVRAQAQQLRTNLAVKLKSFNEQLSAKTKQDSTKVSEDRKKKLSEISDRVNAEIAAIPEVPKNLPDALRKRRLKERSDKISAIKGKADEERQILTAQSSDELSKIKTSAQADKLANITNTSAERERVATDLKAALQKFAQAYETAKQKANSSYDVNQTTELNRIKTKMR